MTSTAEILPEPDELDADFAVEFLRTLDPVGPHNLTAIPPDAADGAPIGQTFDGPGRWAAMRAFIDHWNGKRGLYFSVNEPAPGAPDDKLGKRDIAAARALHADFDPRPDETVADAKIRLRALIDAAPIPPTIVIDSGGGLQCFWKLDTKLPLDGSPGAIEELNRRAAAMIGEGDATQNIDRVMRLPSTWNLPSPKKRARGRTPCRTSIVKQTDLTYSIERLQADLPPVPPRQAANNDNATEEARLRALIAASDYQSAAEYADLPEDLRLRFEALCDREPGLASLWNSNEDPGNPHRMSLAGWLRGSGEFDAIDHARLTWVWPRATTQPDRETALDARQAAREWVRTTRRSAEEAFTDLGGAAEDQAAEEPADEEAKAEAPRKPTGRMRPVTASSLAGTAPPAREWHVPGWIPAGTVTLLYGDGGTGKSLLALQLAVSTECGMTWLGQPVRPGPVLFVSAEDDLGELHRRLHEIATSDGLSLEDINDLTIVSLAGEDALLAAPEGKSNILKATDLYTELDTLIGRLGSRFVVLDTLADLFGGEENQRAQARQFIGLLRRLAIKHEAAVLLLAHPSLAGMASGTGSSGSTGWNNSVRSRLFLERVLDSEKKERDVDVRVLRGVKMNYGRAGDEIHVRWVDGVFVATEVAARQERENLADNRFLHLLALHKEQGRPVSDKSGPNYAPAKFALHPENGGVTKAGFKAAMERLFTAKKIRIEETGSDTRRRRHIVEVEDDA